MPLTIGVQVGEFLDVRNPCLAKRWTITRTDGVVLRFTNHDREIPDGASVFSPAGGFDGSADRLENELREHNKSLKGLITSDRITIEELMGGIYDDAEVTEDLVNWRYPWAGAILSRKFWIDRIKFDGEVQEAELTGPTRHLRNQVGDVLARTCRHSLGMVDPVTGVGCTIDVTLYTDFGAGILGTLDSNSRMILVIDPMTLGGARADGWFDDGEILFTTGLNAGRKGVVKSWTSASSRLVLQEEMPYPIAAGDVCNLVSGCNHLRTTCRDKFGNIVEFGGSPFQPFVDRILRTPKG